MCSTIRFSPSRYAEFGPTLLAAWTRALAPPKEFNLSKLRVDLRLYSDLVSVAVFGLKEGLSLLGTLLTFLVNTDKDNHNNLNIILQFCRFCGDDFAGLASRKMKLLEGKYGQVWSLTLFFCFLCVKTH